jgi:lipoate-protein ligase A
MPEAIFYSTFAREPYFNMAFDEWLLARALDAPGALFVRLYTWKDAAITFGHNQSQETALDFSQVGTLPVIRRVTGGRALCHDRSELTYSVTANTGISPGARLAGSVAETTRMIAEILTMFLGRIGISSTYARRSSPEDRNPEFFHKAPCFASVSRYELLSGGTKVAASALKRMNGAFLQHGSIKLNGLASHPALSRVGADPDYLLQPIGKKRFTVAAGSFRAAFEEAFGSELLEKPLLDEQRRELVRRTEDVKKKALNRRVIIAQTRWRKSL